MKYLMIVVGPLETNCYLVYDEETRDCLIVDPGADADRIFPVVAEEGLHPVGILNTHGHIDHIGANRDMKDKYDVPLYMHAGDKDRPGRLNQLELSLFLGAKDSPPPDRYLNDGDEIPIGRGMLRVIHTPGHSPGSICLLADGFLLAGDTLFFEGVGRTDLPGGDQKQIERSIRERLMTFPDEMDVLPGHGPTTTIGRERENLSFLE
ncbi:MAG: MBL fold metallo-hydrolase [Candidatus Aminicenantes bacterium]|nr:MBL fold metallo-hydrolase [Candidatus Aminicenantes bacterium]